MSSRASLLVLWLCVLSWGWVSAAPLGLTQVYSGAEPFGGLSVIDGVAYIGRRDTLLSLDESGTFDELTFSSDVGEGVSYLAGPVRGADGQLYLVASTDYRPFQNIFQDFTLVELYDLDDTTTPIQTWEYYFGNVLGLTEERVLIGTNTGGTQRLMPDGTITDIVTTTRFQGLSVTPSGAIGGSYVVPGSLGTGPAVHSGGTTTFLDTSGSSAGVRDSTNAGLNTGYANDKAVIRYGNNPPIVIDEDIDLGTPSSIRLTESHFVIFGGFGSQGPVDGARVYFPGVLESEPSSSVALLDYYPELAGRGFERVAGLVSEGGRIHLLLSSNDSLWLFVAPDPTVVPEPGSALLTLVSFGWLLTIRRMG